MAVMTTMSVTVYFNTGFNSIDIPATPSVLNNAQQKTYTDPYYLREDIDSPEIRINDDYNNLVNVDYVRLYNNATDKYSYYFATPRASARKTTILTLQLDALTTMGGPASLTYISGYQTRGHVKKTEDTMFSNTASENFTPLEELEATNIKEHKPTAGTGVELNPVISNIDLEALAEQPETNMDVITGMVEGTTDPVMYIPRLKTPESETGFSIPTDQEYWRGFFIPQTAAYDAKGELTKKGIQKLYSFGQLQLQSSYKIPGPWAGNYNGTGATETTPPTGQYYNISGIEETQNTDITYQLSIPNYTIKNAKTNTMFRTVHLVNIGNGAESIKRISEIYDSAVTGPQIYLWSDPSPSGKPWGRFKYIKNSPLQYMDAVAGLPWANNQIVTEGASGNIWNAINYAQQIKTTMRNWEQNEWQKEYNYASLVRSGANTSIPIISDIGGFFAGGHAPRIDMTNLWGQIGKGLLDYEGQTGQQYLGYTGQFQQERDRLERQTYMREQELRQQQNENYLTALRNENVSAPSVLFTPDINLGLYGYNYYVSYEVRMSNNDIIALDQYFQRFGYNGLHKPVTAETFNARQYYSFVQAFDINIKSDYGKRIRERAISQLNNGVRVWKVLPDASYYELN